MTVKNTRFAAVAGIALLAVIITAGCGGGGSGQTGGSSALINGFVANGTTRADGTVVHVTASVSSSQAESAALAAVGQTGARVTATELGDEEGAAAYEVEVTSVDGTQHDVLLNAQTGAVIRIDTDTEDGGGNDNSEDD